MRNKKGIVLIFVLVTLATLSLLGLGLSFRARIDNKISRYFASEYKMINLAQSKLNQIMFEIIQDDNNYDSFEEDWAKGASYELEGDVSFRMTVEDEDGKLDINAASKEWLSSLFIGLEYLIDEIIKNKPFLIEEEILSLEAAEDSNFLKEDKYKIFNLVTTQNHDKINVNTIREEIIRTLPGLSSSAAETILSLRETQPIENLEVLKDLEGLTANELQSLNSILKMTSSFYTVRMLIDDKKNRIKKSFRITLKKDPENKTIRIVRWLEQ